MSRDRLASVGRQGGLLLLLAALALGTVLWWWPQAQPALRPAPPAVAGAASDREASHWSAVASASTAPSGTTLPDSFDVPAHEPPIPPYDEDGMPLDRSWVPDPENYIAGASVDPVPAPTEVYVPPPDGPNPATYTPPSDNPGGVNGDRPPRLMSPTQ